MTAQAYDSDCLSDPSNGSLETLIDRLSQTMGEVSSLPTVTLQITHLADDPNASAEDLLEVIRRDPALAMRLMRTVNSSYYAIREKVTDLKQAITLRGFREIRNLAWTAYVSPLFRGSYGYRQYTRRGLWSHMVGTAMIAQRIAVSSRSVRPQEAYLGGLLHDLGIILIDQYLHKRFCKIIDALTEETPLCEVERGVLGFDHTAFGEHVAAKWKLPEHLTKAIGCHHSPDGYEGPHREMVCTVSLADCLCQLKGFPPLGVHNTQVPAAQLFAELGLGKEQVASIAAQLDEILEAAEEMAGFQLW
jgi:HD-like signal output (HDOD) protein